MSQRAVQSWLVLGVGNGQGQERRGEVEGEVREKVLPRFHTLLQILSSWSEEKFPALLSDPTRPHPTGLGKGCEVSGATNLCPTCGQRPEGSGSPAPGEGTWGPRAAAAVG